MMGNWYDEEAEVDYEWPDQPLTVFVSKNPTVAKLFGPNGEVLRRWRERRPIGFR